MFQDAELAARQLAGKFTTQDKLSYLQNKLADMTEIWNDLDLHTTYLFGMNAFDHMNKSVEDIVYNSIIESIVNADQHYLFITSHQFDWAEACINVWPNAQIILFENTEKFVSGRKFKDAQPSTIFDSWEVVRGADWPIHPPKTIDELESLPADVAVELKTQFEKLYVDYYCELGRSCYNAKKRADFKQKHQQNIIAWDTDWYFSPEETVKEIGNLYSKLNLTNFNPDAIRTYYDIWASKLKVQLPHTFQTN